MLKTLFKMVWPIPTKLSSCMPGHSNPYVNSSYVGEAEKNLRIRLTQHKQNWTIIEHLFNYHNILNVTLNELLLNVKIFKWIPESIIITKLIILWSPHNLNLERKPDLNWQSDSYINPFELLPIHIGDSMLPLWEEPHKLDKKCQSMHDSRVN